MHTLTHTPDPTNPHDKVTATMSIGCESNLEDMLDLFEAYLRATGYVFDGKLDLVKEDES
mgnify:CR=1 FL=1